MVRLITEKSGFDTGNKNRHLVHNF